MNTGTPMWAGLLRTLAGAVFGSVLFRIHDAHVVVALLALFCMVAAEAFIGEHRWKRQHDRERTP